MMQVQRVKLAGRALAPALLSLVLYGSAEAAELKVFGSRVTKVILGELGPQFEKATGFKPVVTADVAQVISTVEAFRQTLLNAKSITYLKEGASTIHLRKLFDQLGITEAIKAKVVETQGEEVSEFVAEGRVELGLIVIPNIMSVPGAEAVGPCRPRSTPS